MAYSLWLAPPVPGPVHDFSTEQIKRSVLEQRATSVRFVAVSAHSNELRTLDLMCVLGECRLSVAHKAPVFASHVTLLGGFGDGIAEVGGPHTLLA